MQCICSFYRLWFKSVHLPWAVTPPETNVTVSMNKAGRIWALLEANSHKSSYQAKARC